jgi:hypothetical protein
VNSAPADFEKLQNANTTHSIVIPPDVKTPNMTLRLAACQVGSDETLSVLTLLKQAAGNPTNPIQVDGSTPIPTDSWEQQVPPAASPTLNPSSGAAQQFDFDYFLLIDEWTEAIPTTKRDTAVTFNYNRPDNEPPQTLLLT